MRRHVLIIASSLAGLAGLALAAASCGRGGEVGGGDSNLPTQAIGPYKELESNLDTPLSEPFVLQDIAAELVEPAILDGDQLSGHGDRIIVYAERIATGTSRSTIVRADVDPNLEASTEPAEEVLTPTEPWEGSRVGAPAVLRRGDKVILFFEGGDGAGIGRAVSMDSGRSFTRLQKNPVLTAPGARQPTVIASPEDPTRQLNMYFVADSARGPAIFLTQSSDDGQTWGAVRLVLGADTMASADGGGVQIDLAGVEGPCAFGPTSSAGLPYVGLFYVGVSAATTRNRSIGFAGSFDGVNFERFPGGAVVGPGSPDETGPAVRREGDRGILLYAVSAAGRRSIAAARHLVRNPTGSN